jgi:hypothetical protein
MQIEIGMIVDELLPGDGVDKYHSDRIIRVNGKQFRWEHHRGTKHRRQMIAQLGKYSDCPDDVLWTCPDEQEVAALMELAPNDRHWFTTFKEAAQPHRDIWVNRQGDVSALERSLVGSPPPYEPDAV